MARAVAAANPPVRLFARPPPRLAGWHDEPAAAFVSTLKEAAETAGLDRLASLLAAGGDDALFLGHVGALSDFVGDTLARRPEFLEAALGVGIPARLREILAAIGRVTLGDEPSEKAVMSDLRHLKREAHVLIALDDLAGACDTLETVRRLSDLADSCVAAAVDFLLRDAHRQGKLALPDLERPGQGSGLAVLGMGKLGGRELNFSSDIDLILFFDSDVPAVIDPPEATEVFSRLARRLVRILQDRTEAGYVFRTDLRLRPDPGSTPLALPIEAALTYYESRGQNWERAAMIKARPVAGDLSAGQAVLEALQPFVWRKYLDFAAIADVHSIKRQIHAHRGHGEIAVRGHNVKLGRGGIREVEFFVQTQQLIAGGRFPELRGRETVPMLTELAARRWITHEASETLAARYWFLRRVENVLQMIADEQTHLMPETDEGLEQVAGLLGFESPEAFSSAFRSALQEVEHHYAALFEAAPSLGEGVGNLVFTGDADDPDTLRTLQGLGFERPSDICRIIRDWHRGRYRATLSAEARERLTELTPALLRAFGETRRADEALIRFDAFVAGLPAGIQLFSLLQSNPALLRLLATVMGAAPRLAAVITRRPHVFDGLLDPALLAELPNRAYLKDRLAAFLRGISQHEEVLDRLRIFAAEQKFLIGVRLLAGAIDARRAGKGFSDLADLCIGAALDAVMAEFQRRHGCVAGGRIAVLGMGKLGSRELSAGSDVDLILLYDHDPAAEQSDGRAPLAPAHYFARLTQRLIAAVSAPTAEGVLYELDLRLRPSGNKGPVATHIDAFRTYQRRDAWTWEHMALTRARTIAGDADFRQAVEADIAAILALPRKAAAVRKDAVDMRDLIEAEKPPRDPWDLKLVPGGLIDLEFIAQVGVLTGEAKTMAPSTETRDVLAALASGRAGKAGADRLVTAWDLHASVTQIIRLCLMGPYEPETAPPGLIDLLLAATDLPDVGVLEAHLQETSQAVRKEFDRLLRAGARQAMGRRTQPSASASGVSMPERKKR